MHADTCSGSDPHRCRTCAYLSAGPSLGNGIFRHKEHPRSSHLVWPAGAGYGHHGYTLGHCTPGCSALSLVQITASGCQIHPCLKGMPQCALTDSCTQILVAKPAPNGLHADTCSGSDPHRCRTCAYLSAGPLGNGIASQSQRQMACTLFEPGQAHHGNRSRLPRSSSVIRQRGPGGTGPRRNRLHHSVLNRFRVRCLAHSL